MAKTLRASVAAFGQAAKQKLNNISAVGEPEDQLRAPFERLLEEMAELAGIPRSKVVAVGESSLSSLKTRPDYAVTVHDALVGFVELKAPGKGADPRRFKDPHDKKQWEKLRSLPNVLYTDGNSFSLWQEGELVDSVIRLDGDIETSGDQLAAPPSLQMLFESFFRWQPIPPRGAKELARTSARLCRFLRDEVTEQLALGSPALTALATDWRKLLFPEATDERFADGYAQAVTFGLLLARAKKIELRLGLQAVAGELSKSNTLIGAALRLLTDNADNQATLKTSLGTLTRVLDAVDWQHVSKGNPDAWLYFYENFLETYDNDLRKLTGSYYTPPEVVAAMAGFVDEVLRSSRFALSTGLASSTVTVVDPATGTGTFPLGVLSRIADAVKQDEGPGAVAGAIAAAEKRLIAFEMQLGPFAVAQLRLLAEIAELTGDTAVGPLRMFVTNTLGNPHDDEEWIPGMLKPIAESRREANKIKRDEQVTVVIGNPPYKEKAKGRGGWIEGERASKEKSAPLADWVAPASWKVGAHSKHLRNLYVYFWRWATWKVFDHGPGPKTGMVCYITVAGFLSGPGFERMRDYLRRTCDDIWVIDCSPEGHQPEVATRIFQGVQQPICIVLASRSKNNDPEVPATVRFCELPAGPRSEKFASLSKLRVDSGQWTECPSDWRAPFLPASTGAWATFPALEELFDYNGSGVMPGRTWVIAPDADSLVRRWKALVEAPDEKKEDLFHPHLRNGKVGDKHSRKVVAAPLSGQPSRPLAVAADSGPVVPPVRYAFRSFDRQWIIPDSRLINQPNPDLWAMNSDTQVFLTALTRTTPSSGPALSVCAGVPDLDHYNGRGGRVFPLWRDAGSRRANFPAGLLPYLNQRLGLDVQPQDLTAYVVGVVAHSGYTARFQEDLASPGLRIPITSDAETFAEAVELGRQAIWLHTFGERFAEPSRGRPPQPPRLPESKRPRIPADGAIPPDPAKMPDSIGYNEATKRLLFGSGYVENVEPAVWAYEVSGKQVLAQWFSYRKRDRGRPIIGDRRKPSALGSIQPDHWIAEYTTELLNVLNVLGLLIELEKRQADVLEKVCSGPLITLAEMQTAGALTRGVDDAKASTASGGPSLF